MPHYRPHGFVPHLLPHRKIEYFDLPERETNRAHCLLALKHDSKPCKLGEAGKFGASAMIQLNLSARADHCILKLACTIAEFTGSKKIQAAHWADALQCPPKLILS
jgi:predicted ATPase with chaperone activity